MKPSWTYLAIVGLLACAGCSERIGGMSPNYPARDFDPRLTKAAQSVTPVIRALDSHIRTTGSIPDSLERLSQGVRVPPGMYYVPEMDHYRCGIKLGWDPSLWFDSRSRAWTFDPGDGSPKKVIKLNVEPADCMQRRDRVSVRKRTSLPRRA